MMTQTLPSNSRRLLCLVAFALAALAGSLGAATSISQHGITWTFDRDYTTGQYVNGDYWVIGPITITGISPGDTDRTGDKLHGTEINPSPRGGSLSDANDQGFDSRIPSYTGRPQFNASRDVSDNLPLSVAPGSSVVSTISVDSVGADDLFINTAAVLTVVTNAPPAGSFRPPYSGNDKESKWNESQINYGVFRNLPITADISAVMPSVSTAQSWFDGGPQLDFHHQYGNSAVKARESGAGYGRDMSYQSAQAALLLNLDITIAQKRQLLIHYIQRGIDIYGLARDGQIWINNGGHHQGRKLTLLVTAVALGDDAMLEYANGTRHFIFQEDQQHFIVSQRDVDLARTGQSTPYYESDIGMAEWAASYSTNPAAAWNSWSASYRTVTGSGNTGSVLAVEIMGLRSTWNWEPLFRYINERYWPTEQDRTSGSNTIPDFVRVMWRTYRNSTPVGSAPTSPTSLSLAP